MIIVHYKINNLWELSPEDTFSVARIGFLCIGKKVIAKFNLYKIKQFIGDTL